MWYQKFKKPLCVIAVLLTYSVIMMTSIRSINAETNGGSMEGYVSLQLVDKDGSPYAGIQTWLVDESGQKVVASAISDGDGQITISGLTANAAYRLWVNGPGINNGFIDEESWVGPILAEETAVAGPSKVASESESQQTEVTEIKQTEATETELTKVTETELTKVTETELTKVTETELTKAIETEQTKAIETEQTEVTETELTKAIETEQTEMTETELTKATEQEQTAAASENNVDSLTENGELETSADETTASSEETVGLLDVFMMKVPLSAYIHNLVNGSESSILQVDAEYYYERILYAKAVLEVVEVYSFEEMNAAVESTEANGTLNLFVAEDIVFDYPIELNKNLSLQLLADEERILTAAAGRHFIATASDVTLSISMDSCIVLDGDGTGGGFLFGNEETRGLRVTLTGGVIQNCYEEKGAGLFADITSGIIKVSGVVVRNCNASVYGGGIYARIASNGVAVITDTEFEKCTAELGAAVYSKAFNSSIVKIAGGTIDNCYGTDTSYSANSGVFIQPFTGSRTEMTDVNILR